MISYSTYPTYKKQENRQKVRKIDEKIDVKNRVEETFIEKKKDREKRDRDRDRKDGERDRECEQINIENKKGRIDGPPR